MSLLPNNLKGLRRRRRLYFTADGPDFGSSHVWMRVVLFLVLFVSGDFLLRPTGLVLALVGLMSGLVVVLPEILEVFYGLALWRPDSLKSVFMRIVVYLQVSAFIKRSSRAQSSVLSMARYIVYPHVDVYLRYSKDGSFDAGSILIEIANRNSQMLLSPGFLRDLAGSFDWFSSSLNVLGATVTQNGQYVLYTLVDTLGSSRLELNSRVDLELMVPTVLVLSRSISWDVRQAPHGIVSGSTGSGKTYFLMTLLCYFVVNHWHAYVCDPKASDLSNIANSEVRVADTAESISDVITDFLGLMHKRAVQIKQRFSGSAGHDFLDAGLEPTVLVIDELAAYIASLDKKDRVGVMDSLQQIAMMGRSSGCFLLIGVQQANASVVPTSIREQLSLRVLLGQSDAASRQFLFDDVIGEFAGGRGSGIISISGSPAQIFEAPTVGFDMLQFLNDGGAEGSDSRSDHALL